MKYIKNRYVIFAACVILSGIIAFVIVPKHGSRLSEMTEVVKAVRVIDKNTVITEDMLEMKQLPKIAVSDTAITEKTAVIGKVAAVTILPEDNLVPQKFTDKISITDKEYYDGENAEKLAISVTVSSLASSVSGKLLPGDVVSVYGFMEDTKSLADFTDLQYLEVLAVTNGVAEDLSSRTSDNGNESSDRVVPATVTLSVNEQQAKELVVLENKSNLHIAFVGRGETSRNRLQ